MECALSGITQLSGTALLVLALLLFGIYKGWKMYRKAGVPSGLLLLNLFSLFPILVAPLIFFGSVFLFDNPSNELVAFLLFLAINSYSFILIGSSALSLNYHRKKKKEKLAWILPCVMIVVFYSIIIKFII